MKVNNKQNYILFQNVHKMLFQMTKENIKTSGMNRKAHKICVVGQSPSQTRLSPEYKVKRFPFQQT